MAYTRGRDVGLVDRSLMVSQQNEVLSLVLENGAFVRGDFEWQAASTTDGTLISVLFYRPGDPRKFQFAFDWDGLEPIARYSPAQEHRSITHSTLTWEGQLVAVRNWLTYLAREVNAVDLWSQLQTQEKRALIPATSADNAPFTSEERRYIEDLLTKRLETVLRTQRLTAEQSSYLTASVHYLISATARLGKRDWWAVAAGVVFQIGVAAMFAPDVRATIFVALAQALHTVIDASHLLTP